MRFYKQRQKIISKEFLIRPIIWIMIIFCWKKNIFRDDKLINNNTELNGASYKAV